MPGDELGRGAGKGGGAGGPIREAGGAFGKKQAGLEEEYFYRKASCINDQLIAKPHGCLALKILAINPYSGYASHMHSSIPTGTAM
jgi:uncharacterized coiled-coil protein SlyX